MTIGKILFVVYISTFSVVKSHSTGAPEESCENLTPGHGLEPQKNDESIPVTCSINSGRYFFKCLEIFYHYLIETVFIYVLTTNAKRCF